jgi:hypothetical protein
MLDVRPLIRYIMYSRLTVSHDIVWDYFQISILMVLLLCPDPVLYMYRAAELKFISLPMQKVRACTYAGPQNIC